MFRAGGEALVSVSARIGHGDTSGRDVVRPRIGASFDWMLPEGAPDRPDGISFATGISAANFLGRASVALGVTVLLFACYQLWGTGLVEQYNQRALTAQLLELPAPTESAASAEDRAAPRPAVAAPTMSVPAEPTSSTLPGLPAPSEGDPLGRIELPSIGVDKTVVFGVGRDTLRSGPGNYPSSALPGEMGNVAIAGHRTTHGAPFGDLDQLAPGDEIHLDTPAGRLTYRVQGHEAGDGGLLGHRIVSPSEVGVIGDHGDDRLTLTACHPKYSARQRIVVSALLVTNPADPPLDAPVDTQPFGEPSSPAAASLASGGTAAGRVAAAEAGVDRAVAPRVMGFEDSLGWQASEAEPTLLWATVTALTLFSLWVIARFLPGRLVYPALAPVAGVPLFLFYLHLERLLPAY